MPVSTEELELEPRQRKVSSAARPCFSCGTMMEPDEWVLVAGPKLLCRVCFHEQFKGGSADQGVEQKAEEDETATDSQRQRSKPFWGKATGYFIGAGIAVAGAVFVILRWSFTWGFTPLALGVLLAALGLYQAINADSDSR